MPKYVLFTGSPPFSNGGGGCNILTYDLLQVLGPSCPIACLPTRSNHEARSQAAETIYFRELRGRMYRRILPNVRKIIDETFAYRAGLSARRRLLDRGVDTVFAFAGADWRFLYQARAFSRGGELPYVLYVVDDFEESELGWLPEADVSKVRKVELEIMRAAKKVYCISSGYCEHLRAKYGVEAQTLPFHLRPAAEVSSFDSDVRRLVFYGSINRLYASALEAIAGIIAAHKPGSQSYKYRLTLVSGSPLTPNLLEAERAGIVERVRGTTPEEILAQARRGWANILPYAFEEKEKVMVSTSFPTKVTNCAQSGRPTIVFAPSYASTTRYAQTNGWRWVAETKEDLLRILSLGVNEANEEWTRQQVVFEREHSADLIRSILDV